MAPAVSSLGASCDGNGLDRLESAVAGMPDRRYAIAIGQISLARRPSPECACPT